jgi:hypothetical protein
MPVTDLEQSDFVITGGLISKTGGGAVVSAAKASLTSSIAGQTNAQDALSALDGRATMATLRAISPVNGVVAKTKAYATLGDAGGGTWRGVTGADPGTYTHNGGTVIVPSGGNGSAAWLREYDGPVKPEWWGARGDGSTVDTTAIQAAGDWAGTTGESVQFAGRTYVVDADIDPGENITWAGQPGRTVIKVIGNASGDRVFISVGTPRGSITFRDLKLVGEWLTDQQQTGNNGLITLTLYEDVWLDGVSVEYGRTFGININTCGKVRVSRFDGRYCTRDLLGIWNTPEVLIDGVRCTGCDDDGISVNLDGTVTLPVRNQVIIANAHLSDTQGIKIMGPKNVLLDNVTLARSKGLAVSINAQRSDGFHQSNASNVRLNNVVITDVMSRNWFVDGTTGSIDTRCYIRINGADIAAGDLDVPPGEMDPATGQIESPFDYFYSTSGADGSEPVRRSEGVVLTGVTCKRTLPPVTNYSDWGYGEAFTSDGFVDFDVEDDVLRGMAIEARLYGLSRLVVTGCELDAGARGMVFRLETGEVDNLLRDSLFVRNQVFRCTEGGFIWPGTTITHQGIIVEDNEWDLDPDHTAALRGANGTWSSAGNPTVFNVPYLGGARFRRNSVKNANTVVTNTGASSFQEFEDNKVYCDAAVSGFSTSNVGIGNVPPIGSGEQWWIQYTNCDPESSSYGYSLGTNIRNSSGMPTSGKWMAGMFVRARTTHPRELGWRRVTTGSGHTAITDWATVYAAHGGIAADRGDSSVTLNPLASDRVQRWNTPLTTNRTVTLSSSSAEDGLTWRVVRTSAASGGSTLDVGGLATLAAGEWCDVSYDVGTTAYVLTAKGTL